MIVPLKLIDRDLQKNLVLKLADSVFVSLSDGNTLLAFYTSANSVSDSAFDQVLQGVQLKGMSAKIVGPPQGVASAKRILSLKCTVEKEVIRTGKYEVVFIPEENRIRISKEVQGLKSATSVLPQKIKVLIVDDSKTIRSLLTKVLSADPQIEVVGQAEKPSEVMSLIASKKPDVITLDIHMPEMDGVTLLKNYLPRYPIPTVMISSISLQEGPMVLSALESGAVDYIQKPSFEQLEYVAPMIVEKIKTAATAKVAGKHTHTAHKVRTSENLDTDTIIAIGSSTGGTEALRNLFSQFPDQIPPVVVVQHIPPVFSAAFAQRMNELFTFNVCEARDGEVLEANKILIAPGGKQMKLRKRGSQLVVVIDDSPPVNRHKPSVDYLFDSVADILKEKAVGVILTGMGADGAKGLEKMKKAGSPLTIAQDKDSCVVFGMPQAAIKLGCVDKILPLDDIGQTLFQSLSKKKAA